MSEMIAWCDCGWTKQSLFPTWAWLRVLVHQWWKHRTDPEYWGNDAKTGVKRYWSETPN